MNKWRPIGKLYEFVYREREREKDEKGEFSKFELKW